MAIKKETKQVIKITHKDIQTLLNSTEAVVKIEVTEENANA